MTDIANRRRNAAASQSRKCYYCGLPMWESDPEGFASHHGITLAQTRLLRSTAEHLHARCDGGGNGADNIVAAHAFCNQKRHARPKPLQPELYRELVTKRTRSGRWLVGILRDRVTA